LKMFEEPIENTHFFVVVPDVSALLKTFVSRFFLISHKSDFGPDFGPGSQNAEAFIKMSLQARLDFLKNFLAIPEEDEEDLSAESARTKALKFLNSLESVLQNRVSRTALDTSYFHHIFKAREFLRMPGSSPKTLMESVAIVVPNL
nr:hypothetical protein [Candidatus Paceibacterota bacterium]